jgi:hypothetical protein
MLTDLSFDELQFNVVAVQWKPSTNSTIIASVTQQLLALNPSETFLAV